MNPPSNPKLCSAVREALLSGSFETIGRAKVDEHLRQHKPCAEWAAFVLSVTHALALEQPADGPAADFSDDDLLAYWDGTLSPKRRQEIENAACWDQTLFRRLYRVRLSKPQPTHKPGSGPA